MATTTDPRLHSHSTVRGVTLGVGVAFLSGVVLAVQSRLNGELGFRLGDGVIAALWSFGSGLTVLLVMVAVSPTIRAGLGRLAATVRGAAAGGGTPSGSAPSGSAPSGSAPSGSAPSGSAPSVSADGNSAGCRGGIRRASDGTPAARRLYWWQCLGGVSGAFLVITQSGTVGILGVAVFTVAVVAGQAGSSLVVDRLGVGPGAAQPVTSTRIVGAVIALVAVGLTVSGDLRTSTATAFALLPAIGGIGAAWQQAVNGRVGVAAAVATVAPPPTRLAMLRGPLVATVVNFAVGTSVLVVAAGIDVAIRGLPHSPPTQPLLYLGGLCGIAFVSLAAFIVRITGVLLLGLGSVAGQLVGALLLDALTPTAGVHLTPITLAGTLLTLVAIGVAALPARGRPTSLLPADAVPPTDASRRSG